MDARDVINKDVTVGSLKKKKEKLSLMQWLSKYTNLKPGQFSKLPKPIKDTLKESHLEGSTNELRFELADDK